MTGCAGDQICEPNTGVCAPRATIDAGDGDNDTRADAKPFDAGPECTENADCGDPTQICIDNRCGSRCEGVVCNSDDEVCDPTQGICVGGNSCENDDDCSDKNACLDGQCYGTRTADCSERPCMPGLDCVEFDGLRCMTPCETGAQCLITELCLPQDTSLGATVGKHCMYNACRPEGDTIGLVQVADYMGPCNSAGTLDGICVGPVEGFDGEKMGVCTAMDGQAKVGDTCALVTNQGSELACEQGVCVAPPGKCATPCTLFDDEICPDEKVCYPLWAFHGFCTEPNALPAPGVGDPCAEGSGRKCAEDLGCNESEGSTPGGICTPLCTRSGEWSMIAPCAKGECLPVAGYPAAVGVCSEVDSTP